MTGFVKLFDPTNTPIAGPLTTDQVNAWAAQWYAQNPISEPVPAPTLGDVFKLDAENITSGINENLANNDIAQSLGVQQVSQDTVADSLPTSNELQQSVEQAVNSSITDIASSIPSSSGLDGLSGNSGPALVPSEDALDGNIFGNLGSTGTSNNVNNTTSDTPTNDNQQVGPNSGTESDTFQGNTPNVGGGLSTIFSGPTLETNTDQIAGPTPPPATTPPATPTLTTNTDQVTGPDPNFTPTKESVLTDIANGRDPLTIPEQTFNDLGITNEDVTKTLVGEDTVNKITEAVEQELEPASSVEKALEIGEKIFQKIGELLDPTNLPGVGINVSGTGGSPIITGGLLNIPLISGGTITLDTGTGAVTQNGIQIGTVGGGQAGGIGVGGSTGSSGSGSSSTTDDTSQQDTPSPVTPDSEPTSNNTVTAPDAPRPDETGVDVGNVGDAPEDTTDSSETPENQGDTGGDDTTNGNVDNNSGESDDSSPINDGDDDTTTVPPSSEDDVPTETETDSSFDIKDFLASAAATASAAINIDGIGDAAQANLTGVRESLALQERIFNQTQGNQNPFIDAGHRAINPLDQAARSNVDTGSQDLNAALPTGGQLPTHQNTAVQQAVDIINANLGGDVPTLTTDGLPQIGVTGTGDNQNVPMNDVNAVTTAANVAQGVDPFDLNNSLTRSLIDEATTQIADKAASAGGLATSGTREDISKAVTDAVLRGATTIEQINTSVANRQLSAESQEFNQVLSADTSNFQQASQFRAQLSAEAQQRFDQQALVRGVRFNEGVAQFDANLASRAQEFTELVSGGSLTFDQQLAMRRQLSAEDQQIFDAVMATQQVQFAQDQQNFENIFNIDASNFQQAVGMDDQQFQKLMEIMRVGANVSVGAGSNAAQFANAQTDLITGSAAVEGGLEIARTNQIGGAIGTIIEALTA